MELISPIGDIIYLKFTLIPPTCTHKISKNSSTDCLFIEITSQEHIYKWQWNNFILSVGLVLQIKQLCVNTFKSLL